MKKKKLAKIPDDIKPGAKLRLFYGKGNRANRLLHIVAIVDGDQVVMKHWSRKKQWWVYTIESMYWFVLRVKPDSEHLYKA